MTDRVAEFAPPSSDIRSGTFLAAPPPFFSLAFHLRFLPRAVLHRLREFRERQRQPRSGFGPHVQLEIPLLLTVCIILLVLGVPAALQGGSLGGWISTLIGASGLLTLLTWSIIGEWRWRREEGHRYGYAEFMPSVFFFCVVAGGSVGLVAGGIAGDDPLAGALWAVPGVLAGYLSGILAARWVHALGFIKTWFIYLAVLGLVILPIEDALVIFIYASKR